MPQQRPIAAKYINKYFFKTLFIETAGQIWSVGCSLQPLSYWVKTNTKLQPVFPLPTPLGVRVNRHIHEEDLLILFKAARMKINYLNWKHVVRLIFILALKSQTTAYFCYCALSQH